ncbi:MAG: energy-coupled thiamine transporter ThiT [Chloroflexi bacterium]|nr:energy-coupled thiamine transporter ThiT [Chloroflexota bacterium]
MNQESAVGTVAAGERLRTLVEIALAVALAAALHMVKVITLPQGGSVSLEMLPIILIGFRRGVVPGVVAGVLASPILYALEPFYVHPVQLLLDYPIAFGVLGLAGLFKGEQFAQVVTGTLFAALLRLVSHTVSGVVFFASYAQGTSAWQLKVFGAGATVPAVWVYSIGYNASFIIPSTIAVILLVYPIIKGMKQAGV